MMLAVCAITLVLVMLMAIVRAFAGPTFFDRVLAVGELRFEDSSR